MHPRKTAGRRHLVPSPHLGARALCGWQAGLCQAARRPGAPRFPHSPASQKSDIRCPSSPGTHVPAGLGGCRGPRCGEGLGVVCLSCVSWRLSRRPLPSPRSAPRSRLPRPGGEAEPASHPGDSASAWPLGSRPCCGKEQRGSLNMPVAPTPFPLLSGALTTRPAMVRGVDRAPWVWERGTWGQSLPRGDNQIPQEGQRNRA